MPTVPPKPPSINQIRDNARQFVPRWEGTTSEQGEAQTFWNEFLELFGIDRKRVGFFEQRARRSSTGNRGRIDLLWPAVLIAEHKSAGEDLEQAEQQAFDYLDSINEDAFPGVVITSDFAHIRLLDLAEPHPTPVTIALEDLPEQIDRFTFLAGYSRRPVTPAQETQANIQAAALMGQLYEQLAANKYGDHDASVLLMRLLFLFFGDDTGMWERGLFSEWLEHRTAADGSDLGAQLISLFQTLDTPLEDRPKALDELSARFPHVNGHLFHQPIPVPFFDRPMRDHVLDCSTFGWERISPAVSGSLFQSIKTKEARRELGEHYTSETNILRLAAPLFLDELRARFVSAFHSEKALNTLRDELGRLQFLDPACGCGNFLVVTYRELRRLELDILRRLRDLSGSHQLALDVTLDLRVTLDQFFGIELEKWPAQIAETAMFLVDQQENIALAREFGEAPDRLPISTAATIVKANALRRDWSEIVPPSTDVVVFGNPPFNGARTVGKDARADMRYVWGKELDSNFDLVTAWYRKTLDYYGDLAGRWGFVSTNSICQGEGAAPLWSAILKAGWRCRFAHRSFEWGSEAPKKAAVHVSIVGFDRRPTPRQVLWTHEPGGKGTPVRAEVARINPYLLDAPDVLVWDRPTPLSPDLLPVTFGSMANDDGHLLVGPSERAEVEADVVARQFLRPFIGARELVRGTKRWCLWLGGASSADIAASPLLKVRIEAVRKNREASDRAATRKLASVARLFGEIRQPTTTYLGIPRHVADARPYFTVARFGPDVICGDANFLVADADGFAFSVLSSSMFIAWMRAVGGRIKSDPRFSGFTYNTFPLPPLSPSSRKAVIAAGETLLSVRALHPGLALADMYDPLAMPVDVLKAHRALDGAVDKAFGTKAKLETMIDRQRFLLRTYARLTGQQTLI